MAGIAGHSPRSKSRGTRDHSPDIRLSQRRGVVEDLLNVRVPRETGEDGAQRHTNAGDDRLSAADVRLLVEMLRVGVS